MATTRMTGINILLVEDEESQLHLATHILEMRGYRVFPCHHSDAALRAVADTDDSIHLLLTDVRMAPHMSGCLLASRMRQVQPDIQVLYMTGYPASDTVGREVQHGIAGLVKKPFTPTGLLEAVEKALEKALEKAGIRAHV